jgi:lipopolysaccharide export system protein LptA
MIISSDVMTVLYDVGSKAVEKVLAHGNVMVRKDGRVALSNDALYSSRDKTIVLTGDARIVENENQIGGEKITLFIADDRSIVEGRGKVMFYQDKTTENGKKE